MAWRMEKDDDGNDYLINSVGRKDEFTDQTPPIPWRELFPVEMVFNENWQVPELTDRDGRKFYLINADEWQDGYISRWRTKEPDWVSNPLNGRLMCMWFDQHAPMRILMWSDNESYEDALEKATEFLAEAKLKGYFVSDEEMKELYKEAAKELEVENNEENESDIYEAATSDLTYTESGYISSEDWGDCGPIQNKDLIKAAYIISRLMHPDDDDPDWDGIDRAPEHLRPPKF